MTLAIFLSWYATGFFGFWPARFALSLGIDGCQPIRVKTIIACMIFSLAGPLTWLCAVIWLFMWVVEKSSWGWLNIEVVNPCKWFDRTEKKGG
jgi:hypothetical protein